MYICGGPNNNNISYLRAKYMCHIPLRFITILAEYTHHPHKEGFMRILRNVF
jgi:hypothetical protein